MKKIKADQRQTYLNTILEDKYLPEQLFKNIPNYLKAHLEVPACYIGKLDFQFQEVEEGNDEELAHLKLKDPKILRYIGTSDNHEFL